MYPGNGAFNGPPIAIFAFEAGDLIYNNYIATSITAYSPDSNMFFGFPQLNLESWNLPMVEPSHYGQLFNGYWLTGTIVPSQWQGGNYGRTTSRAPRRSPMMSTATSSSGGDSFPSPIVAYAVIFTLSHGFGTVWSVSMNGVTQTTWLPVLVFFESPGSYSYTATLVHGYRIDHPSSGTVTVVDHTVVGPLHHT